MCEQTTTRLFREFLGRLRAHSLRRKDHLSVFLDASEKGWGVMAIQRAVVAVFILQSPQLWNCDQDRFMEGPTGLRNDHLPAVCKLFC